MRSNLNFSCIYAIVNNENGKMYIGSAVNLTRRRQKHFRDLYLNKHHAIALQRAYNKYGKNSLSLEIIEIVKNRTSLITREQHWMDFFKPEYNCLKRAGSCLGNKLSEETKRKISLANKGRTVLEETRIKLSNSLKGNKNTFGRKASTEQRKKLSLIHKGKTPSKLCLERAKKANTGRIPTIETREKIRQSLINKQYNIRRVAQLDCNSTIIKEWISAAEAERILNIDHRNIQAVCKGKRKTAGSYYWKYI